MVGATLMAQMSTDESLYEKVITKGQILVKSDVNCNLELEEDVFYTPMSGQCFGIPNDENVQDGENIYEIIPGDFAAQNCEHCSVIRSYSFAGVRSPSESTVERKSLSERSDPDESNLHVVLPPSASHSNPDISSTQYAEIIHTNKVSDFVPSRPTRDSENPILRQDFSSNLSFMPNLRNLRKHLTDISQERCLEREQRNTKITPSTTPECPRKPADIVINQRLSKSVSPKRSPQQSPRAKNSPGPIYVNMEFPPVENTDCLSRRSSISSRSSVSFNEHQSLSSTEDSMLRDVDVPPYENIRDVLEGSRLGENSSPVDIVYSDLHFHDSRRPRSSKLKLDKSTSTPVGSPISTRVEERSRSLPGQASPKLSQPKSSLDNPRPKSKSLGKLSGGALGFYLARFVKGIVVQRSNSKTLQSTIHDIVSKTKFEDCTSVNVEVTSDMMRISTNCPPWEVITNFDIVNIGCIGLYEQNSSVLGVIVCVPETDAHCYVIECRDRDAQLIYSAVKNAFNSSNSKQSKTFNVSVSTPVGPESWLGDDDVTTFTGISYLGSLKMKKSYLLINEGITSLLERAHPKEFKNIFLEVHLEEIQLIDAKDNTILQQHAIPWILKLGVYEEDPRLFGYIVSEARQGEKTRMFCHVFRCGRITSSVAATEAIRLGCQATYSERRDPARATRRISFLSTSSNGSPDSSLPPTPSPTPDTTVKDHGESPHKNPENAKAKKKDSKKTNGLSLRRFSSVPHLIRSTSLPHITRTHSVSKKEKEATPELDADKTHPNCGRNASVSSTGGSDVIDSSWEIVEEKEYSFEVTYLCSTVINPPLRPKHLRECVKQFQKQQAKALKKFGVDPSNEVSLMVSIDGVKMTNPCAAKGEQEMFFPFCSVSHVMSHPECPEYFAFALTVTGDSKHKCHLFQQTNVPPADLITTFEAFM